MVGTNVVVLQHRRDPTITLIHLKSHFSCFPSRTLKETSDLGARVNDCRTLKYEAGQRKRGKQVYFTQEIWIIKGGCNESQLNGEPLKVNRMRKELRCCKSSTKFGKINKRI